MKNSVSETQISYILDQLSLIREVAHRRMFGGVGIFSQGKMFAMINSKGSLLMKVDHTNIQDYLDRGMAAFSHQKNRKAKMPYYEVPLEVIEDQHQMREWAEKSINIALKSK